MPETSSTGDVSTPATRGRRIPILDDKKAEETIGESSTFQQELHTTQVTKPSLGNLGFTDANGKLHDAETGQFTPTNLAIDMSKTQAQTYESMSTDDLVTQLAGALEHNDRTMTIDVQDELMERVIAMDGASDEVKEQTLLDLYAKAEERSRGASDNPENYINDPTPTEPSATTAIAAVPVGVVVDRPQFVTAENTSTPDEVELPVVSEVVSATTETNASNPENAVDTTELLLLEKNPALNSEAEVEAEQNKSIDQLQKRIDRLRDQVQEVLVQQIARLDSVQKEYEQLKSAKANNLEKSVEVEMEKKEVDVEPTDEILAGSETAEVSRDSFQEAIKNFAEAKIAAEGMFAGEEKRASFEAARAALEVARKARAQAVVLNALTELSKTIDDAMLAERARRSPQLTKINNWLKKHPNLVNNRGRLLWQ